MNKSKKRIAIFAATLSLLAATGLSSCVLPPGDVDIQQGSRYFAKKKFDEARHCFEMALDEECSFPKESVYIYISNCYSQQGNYQDAIEYRLKALDLAEDSDNLLQLGLIYRIVDDDETAEKMFRRVLELNPRNSHAMASLGALCMTHERIDEAIELFENSLDINNLAVIVHADLAICYAKKGMEEDALYELKWAAEQKFEHIEEFTKQVYELLDLQN